MFLFLKKKREESLRPLTEREIQEKLYGHFTAKPSRDETHAAMAEEESGVSQLFTPPSAQQHPKEVPSSQSVSVGLGKPASFSKPLGQRWEEQFSGDGFPKLSVPKILRMKKPRWIEKMESIPLSRVAVSFFALVLIIVSLRALAQAVFNISPGIKIKAFPVRNVEKPVSLSTAAEQKPVNLSVSEVATISKTSAPVIPKKFYTIQLITYDGAVPTQNLVERLREKNLDAFSKSAKTSRGKERYQVFLGRFTAYDQAQAQLARYRSLNLLAEFPDSFVRSQVE